MPSKLLQLIKNFVSEVWKTGFLKWTNFIRTTPFENTPDHNSLNTYLNNEKVHYEHTHQIREANDPLPKLLEAYTRNKRFPKSNINFKTDRATLRAFYGTLPGAYVARVSVNLNYRYKLTYSLIKVVLLENRDPRSLVREVKTCGWIDIFADMCFRAFMLKI